MKKTIILITFLLCIFEARATGNYELPCRQDLLEESEKVMLAEVGIKEKTNRNDGEVKKYLSSVGLREGNPYCAAGQYWVFRRACRNLHIPKSAIPIPRTGLVYNIYAHAKKRGLHLPYRAKRHALIIWQYPNKRRGHVERIFKVGKGGNVWTVGFNTSSGKAGSQDDCEGVYIRKRNIYHPLGRMRIKCLVSFSYI
jgi:hypothetical protein